MLEQQLLAIIHPHTECELTLGELQTVFSRDTICELRALIVVMILYHSNCITPTVSLQLYHSNNDRRMRVAYIHLPFAYMLRFSANSATHTY